MFSFVMRSSNRLYDFSSRLISLEFGSGETGFEELTAVIRLPLAYAFYVYESENVLDVFVDSLTGPAWEGRVVAAGVVAGGLRIKALGHFVALGDDKYTALWSDDGYGRWRPLELRNDSRAHLERFEVDNNNRLYITAKKNETHGSSVIGFMGYLVPDSSTKLIKYVTFDYEMVGDSTNWQAVAQAASATSWTSSWTLVGSSLWSLSSNGSTQTGSISATLSTAQNGLVFFFRRNTGGVAITQETGGNYLRITNLRLTVDGSTISPQDILQDVVDQVSTLNTGRLSDDVSLIEDSGLDLTNEIYEDMSPAEIALKMAKLGDGDDAVWEAGVFYDKKLYFREKGSASNTWYVNAFDLTIERNDESLINSAYATYGDDGLRTADSTDDDSVSRYGFTRRGFVSINSNDSTEATAQRDLLLADGATIRPQASIEIERVFSGVGTPVPKWLVKSGDTLVIRNLPATAGASIDRIRSFRLSNARYDGGNDVLDVVPEETLPELEFYLVKQGEGV